MSVLKPNLDDFLSDDSNLDSNSAPIDFGAAAASVLSPKDPVSVPPQKNGNGLLAALENSGASLEAAARRLSSTLNFPENDAMGLKAVELVFRANGLLREKDQSKKEAPEVNITIVGTGNQTLINLLMPK